MTFSDRINQCNVKRNFFQHMKIFNMQFAILIQLKKQQCLKQGRPSFFIYFGGMGNHPFPPPFLERPRP